MFRYRAALAALTVLAGATMFPRATSGQTTWYVDAKATGPVHDGSGWCSAFLDLQAALAAAQSGDQIRVGAGVYKPDLGTTNRLATFTLKTGVSLLGGYAGCGEADPSARDYALYPAVLSGDLLGNDGPNFANYADNSFHVVTYDNPAATGVLLEGFTVSGGNANGANALTNQGGAIHIRQGLAKCMPGGPTIRDCIVEKNWGAHHGAINDHGLTTVIENCLIRDNHANVEGGGLQIHSGQPTIRNCTFINNVSAGQGGGAWVGFDTDPTCTGGSQAKFYDCVFEGNIADSGGGLYAKLTTSFLIRDSRFQDNVATAGGGMFMETVANAEVLDCEFVENVGNSEGGGTYNASSGGSLKYSACTFRENRATTYAGAMRNRSSNPIVTDCMFVDNEATAGNGGALHNRLSDPTFDRCAFVGNRAELEGGASFNTEDSDVTFKNCSFAGNHTPRSGGALSNHENSSPSLRNCTLHANAAVRPGSVAVSDATSGATLTNCIVSGHTGVLFSGGTITATYSNMQNGLGGIGNINAVPLFADANGADDVIGTEDDDLRLMSASAGINVGDPAFAPASGEEDLGGGPRLAGCRVDMGAHESDAPQVAADFNNDKVLDLVDFADFQLCFLTPTQNPTWQDACVCVFDLDGSGGVDLPDYSLLPWPSGPCTDDDSCNDGDVCNGTETCVSGTCHAGTPLDCDDDDPCTDDSCTGGACTYVNNTASCNDGNACTVLDSCSGGDCVGGAPRVCDDDEPCTDDTCNPATGCVFTADDENSCGDGNECNGAEYCSGGDCHDAQTPACNDGKPCTDDSCDAALGCVYVADDTNSCGDSNVCNGADTCVAGECQTGEPLQCDDEKACTDDACDPTAGCVYTNDDSNSCVDDDACNGQETCSGGSCLAGTEPTCDDHEPCTDDSCDPVDGCVFTANDTNACSDENVCTVGDACHNGVCVSGAEPDCSTVGEECQTASCDPTGDEGNCDQLKPAADGTECDDGDACNVGESCQDGECSGGEPQSCPVRPCATSSCDPAGPEGNCDTVVLADASTPCQADDSLCTIDLCDGSGECAFMGNVECPGPSGECDGGETCNPSTGLCVDNDDAAAGTPCEADDDPCTEDECDGTGNCIQGLGCVPPQVCRPAGCRPPHP